VSLAEVLIHAHEDAELVAGDSEQDGGAEKQGWDRHDSALNAYGHQYISTIGWKGQRPV
jgi:hypothetical protein